MQLPEETKAAIREELGDKALDTYRELGRGCWVFTRNSIVSFVGVADIITIFGPKYPEQNASLLMMLSLYDPESQVVVILSVKRGQQILSTINLT